MANSTFIASAPQPVTAIPAKQVFQLADLLPEDLAKVFSAGVSHCAVIATVVASNRSDGWSWSNAEMLPDLVKTGLGTQAQFLLPEHQNLFSAEKRQSRLS